MAKTKKNRRKPSGPTLTDWIRTQPPESKVEEFDVFFAQFARKVYTLLAISPELQAYELKHSDCNVLALATAGYTADLVTEAGLWQAVLTHNQQEIGIANPFYEREQTGDDDDIPYDLGLIYFTIIYQRLSELEHINNPTLLEPLIAQLTPLVIEAYETAPDTDRYTQFLRVKPDTTPDLIRSIAMWLASDSWLMGWEVQPQFEKTYQTAMTRYDDPGMGNLMAQLSIIERLITARSSFGAVGAWWLTSEIVDTDPATKAEIRKVDEQTSLRAGFFDLYELDGNKRRIRYKEEDLWIDTSVIPVLGDPKTLSFLGILIEYKGIYHPSGTIGAYEKRYRQTDSYPHGGPPSAQEQAIIQGSLDKLKAYLDRHFDGEYFLLFEDEMDLERFLLSLRGDLSEKVIDYDYVIPLSKLKKSDNPTHAFHFVPEIGFFQDNDVQEYLKICSWIDPINHEDMTEICESLAFSVFPLAANALLEAVTALSPADLERYQQLVQFYLRLNDPDFFAKQQPTVGLMSPSTSFN